MKPLKSALISPPLNRVHIVLIRDLNQPRCDMWGWVKTWDTSQGVADQLYWELGGESVAGALSS